MNDYSKWEQLEDSEDEKVEKAEQEAAAARVEFQEECRAEQAEVERWLRRYQTLLLKAEPAPGQASQRRDPYAPPELIKNSQQPFRKASRDDLRVLSMLMVLSHFEEGGTNLTRHPQLLDLVRHNRWLEDDPGALELLCRIHNFHMKGAEDKGLPPLAPEQEKLEHRQSTSRPLPDDALALASIAPELPKLVRSSVQKPVSFTPGEQFASTHNGIRMVSADRRKDMLTSVQDAAAYTEDFKVCCRRKYSNLARCWRLLLDTPGLGRVSFVPFCRAARSMGFTHISTLWKQLDSNSSGFITLESWDPRAYKNLMQFRTICLREFGGLREAFKFGLDRSGSGTCTKKEFRQFLQEFDFAGDWGALWGALDENQDGMLTADELDFLSQWQGERHRRDEVERQFHRGLKRLMLCRQGRLGSKASSFMSSVGSMKR
ncbi:unnamed protein product [Symbiodinium natans]|uniref:Calmodulin n=1 Tax=Symbiodinium natans TaxID=878477 RepID=A0A812N1F5_9DINO|nr:unnamed protein product [Symbiodinium natans]